ncbi:unnamed protein product [Peniophora sp. CBMAI 1063]|nr:unnamed protein product [Peniophora sp. CBMAI 1063]
MSSLDAPRAKGLLRLAAQRLAQMRDRTDAQGQVVAKDISTLLAQRSVLLARAKAQKLIQDEIMADMLEHLENLLGVLSERLLEIDSRSPSPAVVEAASSVIYAQPYIDSKDLSAVRDLLAGSLGPEFLHAASTNRDQCVSKQVIRALSAPPPSAAELDAYLMNIARTHGVQWEPELRSEDVLRTLSELLDVNTAPVVDLPRLQRTCAHGIPPDPSWLRPRTWRILLGTLPVLKSAWEKEATKSRANYYELVKRLLQPFTELGPPTEPPAPLDAALAGAVKDLFRVPHELFAGLGDAPDPAPACPLDDSAPEDSRIPFANILDARLNAMQATKSGPLTADAPPSISVTTEEGEESSDNGLGSSTSRAFSTGGAHPTHASALVRLLYVHSALNPAKRSPHLASVLLPLYAVMIREIEPSDLAHAEADTFWAFEAVVGDFAELEDEEGGAAWMGKFGERVAWADPELASDLQAKGLSPSLPHYSYRWLAPLLTHTLPLSAVLSVWDALFSRPETTRNASPKLDFLLDVCTAMLLRARGPISRLGKSGRRSPGLWGDEGGFQPPPSPTRAWELNDAFIEGMALLQMYPVTAAGGVESILQTAADLFSRREAEARAAKAQPTTLAARVRDTVWRGFTNQSYSPAPSPDASDDEESDGEGEGEEESTQDEGNMTEPVSKRAAPAASRLSAGIANSGIANSLWRGITNRSAMEPSPSPPAPASPLLPPGSPRMVPPSPQASSSTLAPPPAQGASLWSYAEKLRDSDTAASLAKVSTNWRVKAFSAWNARSTPSTPEPTSPPQVPAKGRRSESFAPEGHERSALDAFRRGSLPARDPSEVYSPPPRPAYFKPPRDSWMPQPRRSPLSSPTTPDVMSEEASDGGSANGSLHARGRSVGIRESIASLGALLPAAAAVKPPPTPKSGPRPLLLSAGTSVLTGTSPTPSRTPSRAPSRAPSRSPAPSRDRFDIRPPAPPHARQDSMQSISSIGDAIGLTSRARLSDADSDAGGSANGSRIVRLNRQSMSPMALAAKHARMASMNTNPISPTSSGAVPSPALSRGSSRGWYAPPDSPGTLASSPPPPTPPSLPYLSDEAAVRDDDTVVLRAQAPNDVRVLEPPAQARRLARKKTPPPVARDTSDSEAGTFEAPSPTRSPRSRGKRPAHLRLEKDGPQDGTVRMRTQSPSSTLALPQWDDPEPATTPRANATAFPSNGDRDEDAASPRSPRRRKVSADGEPPRVRKLSSDGRARKISGGTLSRSAPGRKLSGESTTRVRRVSDARTITAASESGAEMGDDEGYDDLLSAYESEDSAANH